MINFWIALMMYFRAWYNMCVDAGSVVQENKFVSLSM
jgi:hypothetical protein